MTTTAIMIVVYIIGILLSYIYLKYVAMMIYPHWTRGDRVIAIIFSFGSIITIIITSIHHLIEISEKHSEKAKW